VRIADAAHLAEAAAPVARAEGFELHARSMEARIRDNQES
jgi:histidinol dehydrogenase